MSDRPPDGNLLSDMYLMERSTCRSRLWLRLEMGYKLARR